MNERLTEQKSIYLQISEMIETDILRGILLEEEQVPSTNELAKLYTINPATAAKGVNLLVDEGILYKRRGIGLFVSGGAREKILAKRRAAFTENHIVPLLAEAKSLGISREELLTMIGEMKL
ncbi:MAG: GntR family transcriptional regulator [Oscillospiraceae bacterium]|nr:GntR family transcriptional regulator [Oscillospiraceae bacterium]